MLLRNARIVLPERVLPSANLEIEGGRILRIAESEIHDSDAGAPTLDLTGLTLFPGFIDLHIHGAAGVDTMGASAEDLMHVAEYLASKGVTAWMPTLVPASAEQYEQSVRAIRQAFAQTSVAAYGRAKYRLESRFARAEKEPTEVGTLNARARLLGVHYEGPFVNSEQYGALRREHFRNYSSAADLDSLPMIETEAAVHMMTVAPEINGGVELIKELRRRSWVVSIGHTRAAPEVLDQAREAGAHHMTHFMNAMSPLHHRTPGAVGWGLLNEDVTVDVIADGVHLDPLMLKVLLRYMTPARMTLISDAMAATGEGDGEYEIWGEKIAVENGRTRNAHGSIAGSVITMLDAVRMMLSLGASEPDVANMASLNPARVLGVDGDCGSIEEGKWADLVALDSEGRVQLTLVGQVAFNGR